MPIPLGVPGAQICIEIPGSTGLYWGSWEHRSVLGVYGSPGLYWEDPGSTGSILERALGHLGE